MAESLLELTKRRVLLDDSEMRTHVEHLYRISMAHQEEWSPPSEGSAPPLFFRSPAFRYTRSLLTHRAQLCIHPENGRGPALIQIEQARHPNSELYGMEVPAVESDGPFNIQRGRYSTLAARYELLENPDPRTFMLEGDPKRLVVQGIIGAALKQFAPAEALVPAS